jgi:hypothetical protein
MEWLDLTAIPFPYSLHLAVLQIRRLGTSTEMRRDAGWCSPNELRTLQKAFNCTALVAISITIALLLVVAMVGNGLRTMSVVEADSSKVTVIYKNQLYPRIGELKARSAQTATKGEANSDEVVVPGQQGQWI